MAKSEQVPCFYAGQQDSWERPAKIVTRVEARLLKAAGAGKFENNGQIFRLSKAITEKAKEFWDGPMGIGNLLPWSKVQNPNMAPEHLHYQLPACADRRAYFGRNMVMSHKLPLPTLPVLAEAFS